MSSPPKGPKTTQTAQCTSPRYERRRHPRHTAEEQVLVHWQGSFGFPCESPAVLRNVSAGGFAIELDEPLQVGSVVIVKTADRSIQCMVRHAYEQSDGYLVGMEILSSSDGSTAAQSLEELSSALSGSSSE